MALLTVWAFAGLLLAQTHPDERIRIEICVINSKNGKPLKNVLVVLHGIAGQALKDEHGKFVNGTTNKLGEVTLQLPSSPPEKLGLFYAGGRTCQLVQCSSSQTYGVAEILKTGTIAANTCSSSLKRRYKMVPKPGELIIFAEPYSKWQCAAQEIP